MPTLDFYIDLHTFESFKYACEKLRIPLDAAFLFFFENGVFPTSQNQETK